MNDGLACIRGNQPAQAQRKDSAYMKTGKSMRGQVFIQNEMVRVFMSCFFSDFPSHPTTSSEHETAWDSGPFATVQRYLHQNRLHLP